jgi:hypothetical protein
LVPAALAAAGGKTRIAHDLTDVVAVRPVDLVSVEFPDLQPVICEKRVSLAVAKEVAAPIPEPFHALPSGVMDLGLLSATMREAIPAVSKVRHEHRWSGVSAFAEYYRYSVFFY